MTLHAVVSRAHRGRTAVTSPGFTLIELLVVIAIIALLIGILLPALAGARVASRQAATLVRLRDLGIGVFAYADDYRNQMPAMVDQEEKAFLGLSLLARHQDLPPSIFINANTTDTPADQRLPDGRLVLADVAGVPVEAATAVDAGAVASLRWHCSFSYDNDPGVRKAAMPIVFMGDRADYLRGRTFSANWGTGSRAGMCLLWTDGHAAWATSRSVKAQSDPNIYHHNEFDGEGADEARDGVTVTRGTQDSHLRFFSEEEDDELLPDAP
ncbi:MAG TPA: prepilin-type N-terminal cleavage/methylation domain-containing protein [Phycisphaerales bacterium]|nr:prepilin-type N-terminal cleavage/methylation domain-containing protein [Phycisphaerales bacterium]